MVFVILISTLIQWRTVHSNSRWIISSAINLYFKTIYILRSYFFAFLYCVTFYFKLKLEGSCKNQYNHINSTSISCDNKCSIFSRVLNKTELSLMKVRQKPNKDKAVNPKEIQHICKFTFYSLLFGFHQNVLVNSEHTC